MRQHETSAATEGASGLLDADQGCGVESANKSLAPSAMASVKPEER